MTATITKRADELKPGDVIQRAAGEVWRVLELDCASLCMEVTVWRMIPGEMGRMFHYDADNAQEFTVESPTLSPAQQHAEELRDTLRNLVDALDNGVRYHAPAVQLMKNAEALLAKIDPPAPPTLEEALKMLDEMAEAHESGDAAHCRKLSRDLLDRARRAGVLK